ncbi:Hypothetical_protein [Hexamita inflata]|uniref:Hypothetical_protein n=1 Tax=Hexamita inflata TaxID=28002 RepID=A0AA86R8U9_9EUKA|nr:Hypothetical protein HINF_LOCUS51310 [Hexamita inflata]
MARRYLNRKPLFLLGCRIGRKKLQGFQFRSINLHLRPKWKEPWLEKRQGTPLIQSVLETPRRYGSEPWDGGLLKKIQSCLCIAAVWLLCMHRQNCQNNGASTMWLVNDVVVFHCFNINSKPVVRSALLIAWRRLGRSWRHIQSAPTVIWTFLHRPAQAVRIRGGAGAVYFECLHNARTAESSCHRARSVSLRLRCQMCSVFWSKTATLFQRRIRMLSAHKRILDLFLENDAAVFPVQLSLFRQPRFSIHTALSALYLQNRGQAVFGFSLYKPTLCSYVPPEQKQAALVFDQFAIGRKLQVLVPFKFSTFAQPQMERASGQAANATDPVSVLSRHEGIEQALGSGREFLNLVCLYIIAAV